MYRLVFKRVIDFIVALLMMPFVLLITVFVALFIKIDDGGPVFYNGLRLGWNKGRQGGVFPMYKFRTMKVNSPDIRLEDGSTYNSNDDPRVTRVGRFLRRTSIDEIPQLFNVLLGDMSLIGPRPDLPDDLANYSDEEKIILTVRPGITGYNQALYRNSVLSKEKLEHDIYYVKNLSFILDCKILIWTFLSVIGSKNIYRN